MPWAPSRPGALAEQQIKHDETMMKLFEEVNRHIYIYRHMMKYVHNDLRYHLTISKKTVEFRNHKGIVFEGQEDGMAFRVSRMFFTKATMQAQKKAAAGMVDRWFMVDNPHQPRITKHKITLYKHDLRWL